MNTISKRARGHFMAALCAVLAGSVVTACAGGDSGEEPLGPEEVEYIELGELEQPLVRTVPGTHVVDCRDPARAKMCTECEQGGEMECCNPYISHCRIYVPRPSSAFPLGAHPGIGTSPARR